MLHVFLLSGRLCMTPIGVKFCMMVHIGHGQIFSPFGVVHPGIPKSEILGLHFGHYGPFDRDYLENGKLQLYKHQLDEGYHSYEANAP